MAQAYPRPQQGQGISREVGGKEAPAGVWRHPNGEEAITQEDPLFGNAQSQGFKQLGFEFVRPAEPGEVKTLPELAMEARAADEDALKGLSARLGALEGVADENKRLKEENARLLAGVPQAPAAPEAEKPLSKMNATELKAAAKAEGVKVTKELNTNKKLAAAVQAARDAKESEQK